MTDEPKRGWRARIWTIAAVVLGALAFVLTTLVVLAHVSAAPGYGPAAGASSFMDYAAPAVGLICVIVAAIAYFFEESAGVLGPAAGVGALAVLALFAWWAPLVVLAVGVVIYAASLFNAY